MSYPNQELTEHRMFHKKPNPNCEYCDWDVEAPYARVKELPIPKGLVSSPIPPWERF